MKLSHVGLVVLGVAACFGIAESALTVQKVPPSDQPDQRWIIRAYSGGKQIDSWVTEALPSSSPKGNWITFKDQNGRFIRLSAEWILEPVP